MSTGGQERLSPLRNKILASCAHDGLLAVFPVCQRRVDGEWRGNITEKFNRLSRAHERYRQTDDRQTDLR